MIGLMEEKIETCMHKMNDVSANLSLGCIKVLILVYDRCGILSGPNGGGGVCMECIGGSIRKLIR